MVRGRVPTTDFYLNWCAFLRPGRRQKPSDGDKTLIMLGGLMKANS